MNIRKLHRSCWIQRIYTLHRSKVIKHKLINGFQELLAEFENSPIDIVWLSSNKRKELCMVRREALIKEFDESVSQCYYEKDPIINENGKLYFESIDIELDP
jgi:hypothetical protein